MKAISTTTKSVGSVVLAGENANLTSKRSKWCEIWHIFEIFRKKTPQHPHFSHFARYWPSLVKKIGGFWNFLGGLLRVNDYLTFYGILAANLNSPKRQKKMEKNGESTPYFFNVSGRLRCPLQFKTNPSDVGCIPRKLWV